MGFLPDYSLTGPLRGMDRTFLNGQQPHGDLCEFAACLAQVLE